MDTDKNRILQDFIDQQDTHLEMSESDLKTYEMLYDVLEKPSQKGFSLGFSNQIIRKIEAKQQRNFNIKMYSLFGVLLLLLTSLTCLIVFFSKDQLSLLFSMFLKYKFAVIFLLAVVTSVQFGSRLISKELEN